MKKGLKTVLLSGLTLILLAGMCIGVSAAEMLYEEYGAYINPAYTDVLGEDDLAPLRVANGPEDEFNPEDYETDFDSAVQSIIEKLVNRDISVPVKFCSENPNGKEVCIALLDAAVAHTGTPREGDYIRYTYGGYQFSIGGWQIEDAFYYNFTYAPTYFTNHDQEDFVDAEVTAILGALISEGMSHYEKVCAIYDYITENVTYDYANLEDDSYTLKYTAYAALHDGTAVCQGYANLFYRMALEAGVDARIISGIGGDETSSGPHAWNIVGLNGWYYDLDATWDAGREEYSWFLRGDANFPDHDRDEMYSTEAFYEAYPMSEDDYVFRAEGLVYEEYDNHCAVTGIGAFTDTELVIPAEYNGKPVTEIGESAFAECTSLTSVTIPNSVTSIGASAFNNCTSLTDVCYTGSEAEWNALKQNIDEYNDPLLNATIHFAAPEEDKLMISAGSVTAFVGKTVRVPIILSDNPGLVSLTLKVSYDTDVFTLIGVEDSELLPGGMHSDRYVSPYYLVWENDTSRENFTVNGIIAELVFAVADDAPEGDYAIEITSPRDGVMNSAGDSVECRLVSGVCTVSDYILGDVNGDGDVTNKDRLILARYLADWEGYELSDMVFGAADINGDGELTNKDRLLLARYLADWEGYGDLTAFRQ